MVKLLESACFQLNYSYALKYLIKFSRFRVIFEP